MKHSLTIWLAATRMVTLRYQLEVSSKTAPSLDVNFGWIRRFRVDGGQTGPYQKWCNFLIGGDLPRKWLHPFIIPR
jgi:hypothetical protein